VSSNDMAFNNPGRTGEGNPNNQSVDNARVRSS
jgi:hypothetical protein